MKRFDVDDNPRRFRFGLVVWEHTGPGEKRWVATFVDDEGNEAKDGDSRSLSDIICQPELGNTARFALRHHAMLRRLLSDLVSAGVLPSSAPDEYLQLTGHEHQLELRKTTDVRDYL